MGGEEGGVGEGEKEGGEEGGEGERRKKRKIQPTICYPSL